MNKFIEENYKWLVRIFTLLGFFFIVKLFLFGLDVYCWSSWYISICIIPTSWEFAWTTASTIAVLFFIIAIKIKAKIKQIKNVWNKIRLAFIIFILGLVWKPLFMVISDDFRFYLTPTWLQYKNFDWEIIDLDKYLELTTKYCNNSKEWDDFNFIHSREAMCGWKFEVDFDTVDEYIKILEHAKNNNFRYLYQHTYRWMDENVWLENVIKKYNDDTFYAYVIYRRGLSTDTIELLKTKIQNEEILWLLDFYIEWLTDVENKLDESKISIDTYWNKFSIDIFSQIKKIESINYKVF